MLLASRTRRAAASLRSQRSHDEPELGSDSPETTTVSSTSNRSSMMIAAFDQQNVLQILPEESNEKGHAEFLALQGALARYTGKTGPSRANVLRLRLLPFLRAGGAKQLPSTAEIMFRLSILEAWWVRLLLDVSTASGADRACYYEVISCLMGRPEWMTSPVPYSRLLNETTAHVLIRLSQGPTLPVALGAFAGKVLSYAYFYCAGTAEALLYLLCPQQSCIDRLVARSPVNAEDQLAALKSIFPAQCQSLVGARMAFEEAPREPVAELYGSWRRHWHIDSGVFASFLKHYYCLVSQFLPPDSESWLNAHLAAPGLYLIQAAIVQFLDGVVRPTRSAAPPQPSPAFSPPQSPIASPASSPPSSRPSSPKPPSATLASPAPPLPRASFQGPTMPASGRRRVDRLRVMMAIREILHNDANCLPYFRPYALQFDRIAQTVATGVSVYQMNACVTLCDFVEEWIGSLTLSHPRSNLQVSTHCHDAADWSFWVHVCQRMATSENCHTEIRALSLLFNVWPLLPGLDTAAAAAAPTSTPSSAKSSRRQDAGSDEEFSFEAGATNMRPCHSYASSADSFETTRSEISLANDFTADMYRALMVSDGQPITPPSSRDLVTHQVVKAPLPPHRGPGSLAFANSTESLVWDVTTWLLSPDVWKRYFCHWNALVRSYYHRLVIYRVASASASAEYLCDVASSGYHAAARGLLAQRLLDSFNRCEGLTLTARQRPYTAPAAPLPGRRISIAANAAAQMPAQVESHRVYPFDIFDNAAYYEGASLPSRTHASAPNLSEMGPPNDYLQDLGQYQPQLRRSPSGASNTSSVFSCDSLDSLDSKASGSASEPVSRAGTPPGTPVAQSSRKWGVFRKLRGSKDDKQVAKPKSKPSKPAKSHSSQVRNPPPEQLGELRPTIQRPSYRFVLAPVNNRVSRLESSTIAMPKMPFEQAPLRASDASPGRVASSSVDADEDLLYWNYGTRSFAEWNHHIVTFEDFAKSQLANTEKLEELAMPFMVAEIPWRAIG